jgi:uncharacterized protein
MQIIIGISTELLTACPSFTESVNENRKITFNMENSINSNLLLELVSFRMPFGKYKDYLICDLPEYYLSWFHTKGFPKGKLGDLLATMYEIKLNGLEFLLIPLKKW